MCIRDSLFISTFFENNQKADTGLPICLRASRVSATLYIRPFGCGLLVTASLRPHSLSGHEADSLTCNHLPNRPSYCQNNPYNDETFDESFHTGDYLFIQVERCNLGVTSRKAPAFLQGLFSSSSVGAGDEDRTRDPLLGKQMLYH